MKFQTRQIFNYILLFMLISPAVSAQRLPEVNYIKGLAFFREGKYDSAIVSFNRSPELKKENENLFYYRGLSYFNLNENDRAIADMEVVEKSSKGRGAIWIARAYARKRNIDQSLRYLEVHLQSNHRLSESEIFLDPDLAVFEHDNKWLEFWKNSNHYTAFDAVLAEADYLIKTENFIEAINVLSDEMKGGFRKAPLYAKRAEVYLALGNDKLALNDLNTAIEGDKRNSDLIQMRADVNYRLGKFEDALADYETALKYDPDNLELYPGRAKALSKNNLYEKALEDMDFYLSALKDDDRVWYETGLIHSAAGKYFKALECFNKSLDLNQTKADYFLARGKTYMNTRTYKYARNDFSMALDLEPGNPEAYYQKALAALQMGFTDEACFCFKQALHYGKPEARDQAEKYCK